MTRTGMCSSSTARLIRIRKTEIRVERMGRAKISTPPKEVLVYRRLDGNGRSLVRDEYFRRRRWSSSWMSRKSSPMLMTGSGVQDSSWGWKRSGSSFRRSAG
ncbi:MAG: hypothetical protein MZV64_22970 [Ignavibacteriales bacterium]|nr:hypothetical protein [Ignavibacteriales bacterium]